jgi:hypothetical protein
MHGAGAGDRRSQRDSPSSLPDLIRQSMVSAGSLRFAALFDSLRVMDNRVKPGGGDGR